MKRNEYEDLEAVAIAAMIGLVSQGGLTPDTIAVKAFDVAEAFQQEKMNRIGEKPGYDD